MSKFIPSTELLNQDPEAFEQYFSVTERESRQYHQRIEKINNFWRDWPLQEAKNLSAKRRLSKLKKCW